MHCVTLSFLRAAEAKTRSSFPRPFTLFDQFPELAGPAQLVVFRHGKFAAEQEVSKRVSVQHAMNGDPLSASLEVDPVILGAITMELLSVAFDDPEFASVQIIQICRQNFEFRQQFELERLRQSGHLGCAQFVEDDLEHGASQIHACYPAANPGENLPGDAGGLPREFGDENLFITLSPDQHNFVA